MLWWNAVFCISWGEKKEEERETEGGGINSDLNRSTLVRNLLGDNENLGRCYVTTSIKSWYTTKRFAKTGIVVAIKLLYWMVPRMSLSGLLIIPYLTKVCEKGVISVFSHGTAIPWLQRFCNLFLWLRKSISLCHAQSPSTCFCRFPVGKLHSLQ